MSHTDPHRVLGVCVCSCPDCTDHPGSVHVTRCICPECPRGRCGAKDGVVSSSTGGVTPVHPAVVAQADRERRERGGAEGVLLAVLAVAVVVALVYGLLQIAAHQLPCSSAPDTCPVVTR